MLKSKSRSSEGKGFFAFFSDQAMLDPCPCEMDFGIPRIKGVNFHGKFGLRIPNYYNCGSKNLEIPKNSRKFQVYSQQDLEFLGIPTQSTNDFPWKAVNLKNS